MKRFLAVLAMVLFAGATCATERAMKRAAETFDPAKRVALVIGVGDYDKQPLANPVRDATAMAAMLKELGFEVVVETNPDRTKILAKLDEFQGRLRGAGVGLFYFAGHGIQMDGENFLLPRKADMESEIQVKHNTIRLAGVLDTFDKAGTPTRIVILDACRNNPFQRTRGGSGGLAVTQAAGGTLIAYSTSPGRVAKDGDPGGNGVYTKHLLKALRVPGLRVEDVFRQTRAGVAQETEGAQVPWENTSLTEAVVLRAGPAPERAPVVAAATPDGTRTRGFAPPSRPAPLVPGVTFRDCDRCPEMVVIPAGRFRMGSPEGEAGRQGNEGPVREIAIERPLAVGRLEVTFEEWEACLLEGGCDHWPKDHKWGRGKRPVIDVSWEDANRYVVWLSRRAGKPYRLLSEAEWEFAARAGTAGARYWGEALDAGKARCADCANRDLGEGTAAGGSYGENPWKLADMLGNVWEWTADCYNPGLSALAPDGSAANTGDCANRTMRGGSWLTSAKGVRAATRAYLPVVRRAHNVGFRVASPVE